MGLATGAAPPTLPAAAVDALPTRWTGTMTGARQPAGIVAAARVRRATATQQAVVVPVGDLHRREPGLHATVPAAAQTTMWWARSRFSRGGPTTPTATPLTLTLSVLSDLSLHLCSQMLAETTAAMDGMRLGGTDPMTMEVAIGVEEATQKLPPILLSAPTAHPLLEAQSGFEAQEELAAQEEMAAQASKEVVPDVVGCLDEGDGLAHIAPPGAPAPPRLFEPLPEPLLLQPPPPAPARRGRSKVKMVPSRHSARQAARPFSMPVSKHAEGRLLKEMGFIDKEEDLNDEAIAAFVKAFDKPLPPHVIAGLRCLTRLDDPASIPSDFAGQDGITTGTA